MQSFVPQALMMGMGEQFEKSQRIKSNGNCSLDELVVPYFII